MEKIESMTFPALFAETIRKNGERPAMALVGENPITYNELDQKINALIAWLEKLALQLWARDWDFGQVAGDAQARVGFGRITV